MYGWNVCVAPRVDSPQDRWSWREMLLLDQRRSAAAAASSTSASTYIPFRIGRGVCVWVWLLFAGKWCCVTGWSNLGAGCGIYHLCSSHSWTQLRSCCHTMLELSHMTRSDAHFRVAGRTVLVHNRQWPADHTWLKESQVWSVCYYYYYWSLFSGAVGWVGIYLWFISLCTVWKDVGFFSL